MSRPNYVPGWWNTDASALRWMTESPTRALVYWIVSGVIGLAGLAWRVFANKSMDGFFQNGRGLVVTAVALLLLGMSVYYGPHAYRARREASS